MINMIQTQVEVSQSGSGRHLGIAEVKYAAVDKAWKTILKSAATCICNSEGNFKKPLYVKNFHPDCRTHHTAVLPAEVGDIVMMYEFRINGHNRIHEWAIYKISKIDSQSQYLYAILDRLFDSVSGDGIPEHLQDFFNCTAMSCRDLESVYTPTCVLQDEKWDRLENIDWSQYSQAFVPDILQIVPEEKDPDFEFETTTEVVDFAI